MLVLSRRIGEKVVINGDIEVIILAVKGHQVRLGIAAPGNVSILREELVEPKNENAPFSKRGLCPASRKM